MAFFDAYFDESGTHSGSPVAVVAGLVAKATQWERFHSKWSRALESFGLSSFHMSDFENLQGKFRGWEKRDRHELLARLLPIIHRHAPFGVGCGVLVNDFNKVKDAEKVLRSPYAFCAFQCIVAVSRWAQGSHRREMRLLAFDRSKQFSGDVLRLYQVASNVDWLKKKHKLGALTFGSPVRFIPLQAADLLAYEVYKYHLNKLSNRPVRESYRLLRRGLEIKGHIHRRKGIEHWINVVRKSRALKARF